MEEFLQVWQKVSRTVELEEVFHLPARCWGSSRSQGPQGRVEGALKRE